MYEWTNLFFILFQLYCTRSIMESTQISKLIHTTNIDSLTVHTLYIHTHIHTLHCMSYHYIHQSILYHTALLLHINNTVVCVCYPTACTTQLLTLIDSMNDCVHNITQPLHNTQQSHYKSTITYTIIYSSLLCCIVVYTHLHTITTPQYTSSIQFNQYTTVQYNHQFIQTHYNSTAHQISTIRSCVDVCGVIMLGYRLIHKPTNTLNWLDSAALSSHHTLYCIAHNGTSAQQYNQHNHSVIYCSNIRV